MNDPAERPQTSPASTQPGVQAPRVAVVGAGPAGLMAAEVLCAGGAQVDVFDAMPSPGRKFLLAGRGGLNLTHSEAVEPFVARYGSTAGVDSLRGMVRAFDGQAVRQWAQGLGVQTFVGSSGRVFPVEMKAAPLLRAWLRRLGAAGVRLHVRHRWLGWAGPAAVAAVDAPGDPGTLVFQCPDGERRERFDAVVLALGGASWSRLGSDGAWVPLLQGGQGRLEVKQGGQGRPEVKVAPLRPANCGFDVAGGWSDYLRQRFAGQPVKPVAALWTDSDGCAVRQQGEFVLTDTGVEGSLIYAASAPLRDAITAHGQATLVLDLLPAHTPAQVLAEVTHARGSRSLASHLKSRLNLGGLKLALLHEVLGQQAMREPARLAAALKALPMRLAAPRPLDEAISTAGGVCLDELDAGCMLRARPGVFCAGEMLDWEAPTGGYLLTACMATGRAAGQGVLRWLARAPEAA